MSIIDVTVTNFEEKVIKSDKPVLVDFYTDDCGPCDALKPVLLELQEDLSEKLLVTKFHVTIDEVLANSNEVATTYDVMGFPTILIFKNGELVESLLGGQSRDSLEEAIEKHI